MRTNQHSDMRLGNEKAMPGKSLSILSIPMKWCKDGNKHALSLLHKPVEHQDTPFLLHFPALNQEIEF